VENAGIPYQTLYCTDANDRYAVGAEQDNVYADKGDDVIEDGKRNCVQMGVRQSVAAERQICIG